MKAADRYIHICTKCGKECRERPGKTPKSDPVSTCCRAPCHSFTDSAEALQK